MGSTVPSNYTNKFFFFTFFFFFKLNITVLDLPNIKMNPPQEIFKDVYYACFFSFNVYFPLAFISDSIFSHLFFPYSPVFINRSLNIVLKYFTNIDF